MQITDDLIKTKSVEGHLRGYPVVVVETYGGLYAAFCKSSDSTIKAIAAAPHRGILRWMCEKKEPELKWNDDAFQKSEDEAARFQKVREFLLGPCQTQIAKAEPSGYHMVYDPSTSGIFLLSREDLVKSIRDKEVGPYCIVRSAEATEPHCFAFSHPTWSEAHG